LFFENRERLNFDEAIMDELGAAAGQGSDSTESEEDEVNVQKIH